MEGVFVSAFGDDDSGQETPVGFRDTPSVKATTAWSRRRRSAGVTLQNAPTQRMSQAPTQRDTQAPTQRDTQAPTEAVTLADDTSSVAPVFVVADPIEGLDEQDGPSTERQEEEVDEDETQIMMMSLSQGHEAALRAAAAKISEEDMSLDAGGNSISLGAGGDASTEDGADSDLSDDMLEQDGAVGISSLANLFNRPDEDDEPRKKPTSLVYTPHSSYRLSPANSWRDASDSSGGETELEPEHEDEMKNTSGNNTAPDAARSNSFSVMSAPDTPQQRLSRSLSTPERARRVRTPEKGSASKRQQQKPAAGGSQPKRIRLDSAEMRSQAPAEQDTPGHQDDVGQTPTRRNASNRNSRHDADTDAHSISQQVEPDQSTQSLPPKSRRRIALTPTPSPTRSRSTSVHSESVSDVPETAESAEVRIVLTGLEPTAAIRKKIKAIAGATYQAAVEDATHIVAPRGQLKRTVKLLCGISCCAHILDERWLDESARMGSTVDEKAFCLRDEAAEAKWAFSLRDTMYDVPIERRRALFAGLRFYITNHKSVLPPVRELVKIVECAGGQASFKGTAGPDDIVITSEAAAGVASVQKALAAADREKIFTSELILTSILQQRIDLTAHRLELPKGSSRGGKAKRAK